MNQGNHHRDYQAFAAFGASQHRRSLQGAVTIAPELTHGLLKSAHYRTRSGSDGIRHSTSKAQFVRKDLRFHS